jgi:uncharacterized protein YcbX
MRLHVSSLAIYPVKSTAALALEQASVEPRGLALDRRWMVVDGQGGCLTGREQPALLRVTANPVERGLVLEAPGRDLLRIDEAHGDGGTIEVHLWGDTVTARRVDERADRWLAAALGVTCRLVYMGESAHRPVDPDHARAGDEVSFADGFPLLLVGEASLADLNARAPRRSSMRRFRPNVTVAGAEPYAEDGWRRLRIGGVEFEAPKPCDRCVMVTIDPDDGVPDADREPLRTLAGYRRDAAGGIFFGVNLIPRGTGTLRVGDPVEVLE